MFRSARSVVAVVLIPVLWATTASAVTVQLELESEGEPVPNAEVSFETTGGTQVTLSEVGPEPEPEPAAPPTPAQPAPEAASPSATARPASRPDRPEGVDEAEPETPPAAAIPEITRVKTDVSGRAQVEISEEYRDEPVVVVIRKDGEVVSRRQVVLTGEPVRLRIDVPAAQLALATDSPGSRGAPEPAAGPSVSVYGKGGTLDRGGVSFLRTEIGGIVVTSDFAEVDREDAFYGVGGEATVPLGTHNLMGLALDLNLFANGFWGTSEVDENLGDISANGNQLGILGPEGPGGPLGGGLVTDADFGDLTDARYSDDYEEVLFRFGLEGRSFAAGGDERRADAPIYFTPRIAFLYGHTDEDSTFRGTTNLGTVNFEYENALESDRFGGELGLRTDVPLSTHFGVYLDGGLRVTYDDAKGSTSLKSDFMGDPFPSESESFSKDGWHLGGTIGGGLNVNYGNFTGSLGVEYETWQVPVPRVTGTERATIDFQRRESITGTLQLRIDF